MLYISCYGTAFDVFQGREVLGMRRRFVSDYEQFQYFSGLAMMWQGAALFLAHGK